MPAKGGRPRKPPELREREGNAGHRPIPEETPKPTRVSRLPICPRHLQGDSRREWHRVTRWLDGMHLLTVVDTSAVEAYCVAWKLMRLAEDDVDKYGTTIPSGDSRKANPATAQARAALAECRHWMAEFGLTPVARTRLQVKAPPAPADEGADPADDFDAYLEEGGLALIRGGKA